MNNDIEIDIKIEERDQHKIDLFMNLCVIGSLILAALLIILIKTM